MGAPGKRGMSEQPSSTYGRRQDRKLKALRCTARCTEYLGSSAGIGGEERINFAGGGAGNGVHCSGRSDSTPYNSELPNSKKSTLFMNLQGST